MTWPRNRLDWSIAWVDCSLSSTPPWSGCWGRGWTAPPRASCWNASALRHMLRKAGRGRLVRVLRSQAPRMAERLTEDILTALEEQTVTVPGTDAAALIIPSLARC